MNISISPNIGEIFNSRPADKPSAAANNNNGTPFVESLKALAAGQLPQVAADNSAASLNLKRQKEGFDELFSFTQAEDELAEECRLHIEKLLDQLKQSS
jgi:hypothetical protein